MVRSKQLLIRLKPHQHAFWLKAARRQGLTLSQWVRYQCDRAARM